MGFGGFMSGLSGSGGLSKVAGKMKRKRKSGSGEAGKESYGTPGSSDNSSGEVTGESFKKGGVVKKTGLAKVHKGERVLTKAQQKKLTRKKIC